MKSSCYLCGAILTPIPPGHKEPLQPTDATVDHIPPRGIFTDPKPNNLITVACCNQCNNRHSGFDDRLRAFAAIEISKNAGGAKILVEKVIGSTMKKGRQAEFFRQMGNSMREKVMMTPDGPKPVTIVTVDKGPIIEGVIDIAKGLLAHFYPSMDYYANHFEAIDIHSATLDKGQREEQLKIVAEIAQKTPRQSRGNHGEFIFWHHVESSRNAGVWLLLFYEAVAFVVMHHPKDVDFASGGLLVK